MEKNNKFVCVNSHVNIFYNPSIAENISTSINYMIDYGQFINNPQAAKIFDDMDEFA